MGHNAIITIRNQDLDLIAADAGFGAAVSAAITGSDYVCFRNRTSGLDRSFHTGVRMSDVADRFEEADGKPYDLMTAPSHHSSGDRTFLVRDGVLRVIVSPARTVPFDDWLEVARIASSLGIQSMFEGRHDTRKAPEPVRTEREIMRDWSDDAFRSATTSVCVLIDGLDRIRDSQDFGERLADRARYVWKAQPEVFALHEKDPDQMRHVHVPDHIPTRQHGNPASIIGFTPEGETDLVMAGQNHGRILRAMPQATDLLHSAMAGVRERDLRSLKECLRDAGFSVQHTTARMQPPSAFMSADRADPEYRRQPTPAPDEDPQP